jgi:hypothetical protein
MKAFNPLCRIHDLEIVIVSPRRTNRALAALPGVRFVNTRLVLHPCLALTNPFTDVDVHDHCMS